MGSKIYSSKGSENDDDFIRKLEEEDSKKSATDTIFKVKDLSINVNETSLKNRLASFVVNGVSAFIETKATFLKCIGKLNKFSIIDDFLVTAFKANEKIFVEKLMVHGKKPIEFEFLKNLGHPEILKTKMFESFLKLKLDSAKYIHVQSFLINVVNYFQQFLNNMDAFGRSKALAQGQKGISFNYQRGSRVKLDIEIQEPTLILPLNSKSKNALVLKFDSVKVENKFLTSDKSEILSALMLNQNDAKESAMESQSEEKDCLLDCIGIQLSNMIAYSAMHHTNVEKSSDESDLDIRFNTFYFKKFAEYISRQKYSFTLQIERNLENELSHKSPDWNVYAKFSSIVFKLNCEQYKIVRGFLDQNLGEPIKSNSQVNFLIPNASLQTVLTGNVWKAMRIHLAMSNVCVDLVESKSLSIAFFKLENSSLIFESYSDTTKLVDLVSHEISINESSELKSLNMLYRKANASSIDGKYVHL